MNPKDPANTIERLTNALNTIAVSGKSAKERAQSALITIIPLKRDEFPITAQQFYDFIVDQANHTDEQAPNVLEAVWNLYWEMSSNRRYR